MSTHLDLLNKLPSPIREQAIENAKKYHSELAEHWLQGEDEQTIAEVVFSGMCWVKTPQGTNYWEDIYKRAEAGEFDDPSVTLPREDWEWLDNMVSLIKLDSDGSFDRLTKIRAAIQSQLTK